VKREIIPVLNRGIKESPFMGVVAVDCFTQSSEECPSAQNVHATDLIFIMFRSSHKPMSTVNPEKIIIWYLPIIQAPASELDTLNAVIKRVLHEPNRWNSSDLTEDEALYPKLLELK